MVDTEPVVINGGACSDTFIYIEADEERIEAFHPYDCVPIQMEKLCVRVEWLSL